ncbi:dipeptidase [Actinokineospora sp. UTMC 2448]|uniref:dipeptidase n=1 Tax=Actinokineospora sp. UTMC 2448 TaxID=2268449 RepID=UPI002164228B|nr:dipeptidase [Actinokineospora sp. UTMC 2448]UVS78000.1 Membrane dipeptidase (Peptidase family M19) [Actinokineospora sp. UTMC 2448]
MADSPLDRALRLLASVPLVDGHNDLAWTLRDRFGSDLDAVDLTAEHPDLHTDLPRLRRGRVGAQFWSVYVPSSLTGHEAVTAVLEQIDLVHEIVGRHSEHLALARTADSVEQAFDQGRIASLLGAEGGHCIAGSLGVLRALHRLGVRYLTLTHNDNTPWADSATDEPVVGGLSGFGVRVVAELNRLGMLVDLSHVAATTMHAALDAAAAPVVFSHSSCRAITDHVRNVPDDVLERLPGNGGVIMITFVPAFVSQAVADWDPRAGGTPPRATLADVVAHIEHAREVAGIDHVGIGGDYDGCVGMPDGLPDVSAYPRLFAALLERGWSASDCAKVAGRNVLRVLRAAEDAAAARS